MKSTPQRVLSSCSSDFVPQGQNHIAPVFAVRLSWDGTAKRKVKPKGAAVHWGCDALS
ncbi:hypothetical protein [Sinomicrobium oceani]|uniref:hypothetical protein n=1 Tax=Sinomicrobium oceani TaxID=1150368 RepID=UPI00227D44ED|nr:hypothetical protein [Sinomicrobium oceani]